jgi:hypothetical protein
MLFSAQKQHQQQGPTSPAEHQTQSEFSHSRPREQLQPSQGTQASLHSFWKLPISHTAPTVPMPSTTICYPSHQSGFGPSECEDCGRSLVDISGGDSMDVDSDVYAGETSTNCSRCGKHVCSHCCITNLGEQRQCLHCAGKNSWAGGLTWPRAQ